MALNAVPETDAEWQEATAGRSAALFDIRLSPPSACWRAVLLVSLGGRIAAALDVPPAMMLFVVAFAVLAFRAARDGPVFLQARRRAPVSRLSVVTLAGAGVPDGRRWGRSGCGDCRRCGAAEVTTIGVFALGGVHAGIVTGDNAAK
jgi:hypothetical protein